MSLEPRARKEFRARRVSRVLKESPDPTAGLQDPKVFRVRQALWGRLKPDQLVL